jgi:RNA polymerase sigma-70 factor (ECF subfamily)
MRVLADGAPWREQYEALYRQHFRRVARLCRLLLDDREEAEDVAQEVFLKLARRPPMPGQPADWGAWLTRITINACRDRRRSGWWKGRRLRREAIEEAEAADPEPTPERAALSREIRERLWMAFRALPRLQREVFVLRYLEEWSTQEVAQALALTPGSVKRHLFRAVRRLRTALGGGA